MHPRNIWAAFLMAVLILMASPTLAEKNSSETSQNSSSTQTVSQSDNADDSTSEIVVALELNQPPTETITFGGSSWRDEDERLLRLREVATAYLGCPYRWGGTTPSAFDCSGFTRYVYMQVGVRIPRTAREQYRVGEPVRSGNWETGDLIFFDMNKGYVSHVGMYLGGYRFIHASTPRSGVRIDNLKKKSYKKHYVGARRYDAV